MPVGVNIAPADFLQVVVVCSANQQAGLNVLHFVVDTAEADFTLQNVADAFSTLIGPAYRAWMPPPARFEGVTVRRLNLEETIAFGSTNGNGPGTTGTDLTPTQVSGILKLRTNYAGPAQRGRMFIPFPAALLLDNTGELGNAGVLKLSDISDAIPQPLALVSHAANASLLQVIRHGDTLTGSIVQSRRPSKLLGTQRRRGDEGQRNIIDI